MLKREFHNSVNEIFSKSTCEEEMKIKCDLNGFDYEFCRMYYDKCINVVKRIKRGINIPETVVLNTGTGKLEIKYHGEKKLKLNISSQMKFLWNY